MLSTAQASPPEGLASPADGVLLLDSEPKGSNKSSAYWACPPWGTQGLGMCGYGAGNQARWSQRAAGTHRSCRALQGVLSPSATLPLTQPYPSPKTNLLCPTTGSPVLPV